MCGIVGAVGEQALRSFIVNGLKSLEYRGYDSAGAAFLTSSQFTQYRIPGRVHDLDQLIPQSMQASVGIGHTRWATHGEPNMVNTHPHTSQKGLFSLVHNGVIDNFRALKKKLELKGYTFQSETDTEVIVNLLEDFYLSSKNVLSALQMTMEALEGSYALAILFKEDDSRIYFAKLHSPLVVGRGNGQYYLASDYLPMLQYAQDYYILTDHQFGYMDAQKLIVHHLDKRQNRPVVFTATDVSSQDINLNGYPHYMLKEIEEAPMVIRHLLDNYTDGSRFLFDPMLIEKIHQADQIIFLACGTSYHAALIGRRYFESIGKTSRVYIASEFAYYPEIKGDNPLFIVISQSGETADLIRCIDLIKDERSVLLTITNSKGSSLDRASDFTLLLYAGMEIAVASTKAYIAQVTLLALLRAALIGNSEVMSDLKAVIDAVENVIEQKETIRSISDTLTSAQNAFFLGRGLDYDVALEASLKLKEITYIHSEAFPGGELKHGPIALIQKNVPVIAFISDPITAAALRSNLQEVKARGAKVISITNLALAHDEDALVTKETKVYLSPIVKAMVGQYLSYYVALALNKDIDKPRNLAKSVTVE
jgi:glutamine---fructose-6-phosphate transaminase (isomerizing)